MPAPVFQISYRVAGTTIAIASADADLQLAPPDRLGRFLAPEAEADVRVQAEWGDLAAPARGRPAFRTGEIWDAFHNDDGTIELRFCSPALGPLPYKAAILDPARGRGRITMHRAYFRERAADPLEYPLDELLTWEMLAAGRGVAIHASSVIDRQGRGFLFVGESGAGKTSMARLWHAQGAPVPSDERTVITMGPDGPRLHGTPWPGEGGFAEPLSAPLRAIYFVHHGRSFRLDALGRSDAAARLIAMSFVPFHSRAGLGFALSLLDGVVAAVPCHDLFFPLDPAVVGLLERQLAS